MEAGFTDFCTCRSFPYASRLCLSTAGFAWLSATSLAPAFPSAGSASLLRHSIIHTVSTGISTCCPSTTPLGLALGPDLPRADEPSSGNLGFSVRGILTLIHTVSTGISTCCPSTTPLGLALGPDLPRADEPSSGNLGFSVRGILTHVSLLTPAFSLLCAPRLLTVPLLRT